MQYTFYPIYDSTIYEYYPASNSGQDQILELIKTYETTLYNSRILIKFDIDELSTFLTQQNIITSEFYLQLFTCNYSDLNDTYELIIAPISGSWTEGTDKITYIPNREKGVSWNNRSTDIPWLTSSYSTNVTGSYTTNPGGGNWYTNHEVSQSYANETDVNINITPIVNYWLSGSANNGLIIKRSNLNETDSTEHGTLQFYSHETHTIFQPRLVLKTNDFYSYTTGSLEYATLTISASQTTTLLGDFPVLDYSVAETYGNNFDSYSYTTSSVTINSSSLTELTHSTIYVAGDGLTGSFTGWNSTGSLSASVNTYIYGSVSGIFNGTVLGSFPSATYTTSSVVTNYSIAGSVIGYLSGSLSGSFIGTYSGSYMGTFTPLTYSGSYVTQSYEIIMPVTKTTYYYSSSQELYVTGSNYLTPIPELETYVVSIPEFNEEYQYNTIPEFRFFTRKQYPEYSFVTQSQYLDRVYCLPETTYYFITDVKTGEIIIEKSEYSKLCCSYDKGNYIYLPTNNLSPERYYNLILEINSGSYASQYEPIIFKVVND